MGFASNFIETVVIQYLRSIETIESQSGSKFTKTAIQVLQIVFSKVVYK